MMKIVILGATGSLGTQALEIIERYEDRFSLIGISAHQNTKKAEEIAERFSCEVKSPEDLIHPHLDHLMVLDHGLEGLRAVLKALAMKKRVSIANKELLIAHGEDIRYLAEEQKDELIPLDSEHNAIFQCLRGEKLSHVRRLVLTASGGPFRDRRWEDLKDVTPEEVLNHPIWKMGPKTTVDSATLVNKAFEVIEAHYLFDLPYDRIEVRLHPESIVHAIVEFTDGTSKMLAYPPDMKYSLGYSMFYPERAPDNLSQQPYYEWSQDLHFEKIEKGRFPCFDLVLEKASSGADLRQLVAADERAVQEFLRKKITFHDILKAL